ncbi:MAG: hypothetical protein IH984_10055 [Planctomycetes bacterium]|nr:hypothetical protein [Planctomycetota bacterium]
MEQVDNIAQAINDMPTAGMIPVVLALITGLLLWAAGRKILLYAFAVIGLIIGVAAGWVIGELIGLEGMEIWIPTIVGGAIFACIAALASRLVIALALALTLGIAAPLATMTISQMADTADSGQESSPPITDAELETLPLPDEVADWLKNYNPDNNSKTPSPADEDAEKPPDEPFTADLPMELGAAALGEKLEIPEEAQLYVDHIKHIANQLITSVETNWENTPSTSRSVVVGSGIVGLLLGMLLGVLAKNFSTVVVTAFGGSLLWLGCAWTLANHLGVPEGPWMPGSSASWLMWWMVTAVIGLAIQWTMHRKRADKSAD